MILCVDKIKLKYKVIKCKICFKPKVLCKVIKGSTANIVYSIFKCYHYEGVGQFFLHNKRVGREWVEGGGRHISKLIISQYL